MLLRLRVAGDEAPQNASLVLVGRVDEVRIGSELVRDIAAGRHPVYVTAEDDVSPAEAARMLGVSRQFVDRLLAGGRLAFAHKPGSTHRTIRVAAVEQFANERIRRRTNTDKAIDALLDGGLGY